jgi:hypothetical protein
MFTSGSLGLMGVAKKANARKKVATKAGFDPTSSVGVLDPLGYWDPLGFMKQQADEGDYYSKAEWKDEATFNYYRAAELKHGRLAMVGLTGMITAAFTRFPVEECRSAADGLKAIESEAAGGLGIIFLIAAYVESQVPSGDFKDPLGWGASDEEYCYGIDMQNKELAHGRLAMSSVLVLWLYDLYQGLAPSDLIRTPSPQYVIVILGLLLVWSQNVSDQIDVAKPPNQLPAPEAPKALPESS